MRIKYYPKHNLDKRSIKIKWAIEGSLNLPNKIANVKLHYIM